MAAGLFVIVILDMVMKLARNHVISWNGAQFEHLARLTAVERILRCPMETFEKDSPAAYMEKVGAISTVKDFYSAQIATLKPRCAGYEGGNLCEPVELDVTKTPCCGAVSLPPFLPALCLPLSLPALSTAR